MKIKKAFSDYFKNKTSYITFFLICGILLNTYADLSNSRLFDFSEGLSATTSVSKTNICLDESVSITFEGSGGTAPYTFTYKLNDIEQTPVRSDNVNSKTITLVGTSLANYKYKLIKVKDATSTELSLNIEKTIKVNAPPVAKFSFNNDNACSGETIQFNNNNSEIGSLSYSWNFGDGTAISTKENPTHVFDALGCGTKTFNVTLTVTDENGCFSSESKSITVKEKPGIRFRDQITGLDEFSNCDNASSTDPNYNVIVENISSNTCIDSLFIDWGDGTTTTSASFPANHTYATIGVFTMTISADGTNGCKNKVSYQVKNVTNPGGGFASPGNTSNLCIPENELKTNELNFGITSWGENSIGTEYIVDYGDGITKTYTQSQLVASTYYNASDPKNSTTFPTPHSYSIGSCLETNGEFIATLTIRNACDSTKITIDNIIVLEKPEVDFDVVNKSCIKKSIFFDNKTIVTDGVNCVKNVDFIWDFGDGTIVKRFSVDSALDENHTYTSSGTYTVSLTIQSFCSPDKKTITKEICIEPEITPVFSVDKEEGCIPLSILTMNNTTEAGKCNDPTYEWSVLYTADNCGTISNWDFTNGTNKNSENPEFIFNNPGKYTLKQKITTECGIKSTTKIIDVKKPPTVNIQKIIDACGNTTINPKAIIENCTTNTASLSYNWTFTGGTPENSTDLNPGDVEYNTPGVYKITLEVTNDCGVSNTATEVFEVFEKPVMTNTASTQEICSTESTSEIILNTNNTSTTFSWTAIATSGISGFLTSGNSNTIPAQILTNSENSVGTVTYTAIPKLGTCEGDSVKFIVTVNPAPIFTTQPISSEICLGGTATPLKVTYENGTGTPKYQWFSNIDDDNTTGTKITGKTDSNYTPPANTVGEIFYYVELSFASGGCDKIISNTANVNVVPQIAVDPVTTPQTICVGGTANELEVTFSGGNGNATYQWFSNTTNSNTGGSKIDSATNSTFTPNSFSTDGTFYYYADISLNGNGCNTATSGVFEINVLTDPIIDTQPIASQELCQSATPVDLNVTVSGGTTSDKAYQWYETSTNSIADATPISGETSGTYTPSTLTGGTFYYYAIVSQTESDCSVTSAISQLKVNESPIFITQPTSSEICLGGTATPLKVAYTNGTGTPTYQWFSNTTNINSGGTKITDETTDTYNPPTNTVGSIFYYAEILFSSGGCNKITSNSASIIINEIPVINATEITVYSEDTFNFDPNSILGNTVPMGTKYTWSAPNFNPIGSILGASAEITPQDQISQTLENTGTSPIKVIYNITPATTKCTGTPFTLQVTVNPNINSNAIIVNNTCFQSNNGAISTTIAGGIPFETGNPYLIYWTGPNGFTSTNTTITNLEAGLYILKIEDKDGFSITEELTVTEPAVLAISKDIEKNISCFEGNDGAIEVTISGGTLPYTYNWTTTNGSGIILNTKNQNTLTAGNYTLEITDKNNCTKAANFILTEPDGLKIESVSKQDILCFGDATGAIEINLSGGTLIEISPGVFDYLYSWSGPNGFTSSLKNINTLIAGTYTVAVTDNLGCTTNASIVINQSSKIEIKYTKTDVTCYGKTDGSIDVTVTGGKAPYKISWSNLANGFSLSNLSADTYITTITDANNCIEQVSITIEQPIFFIDPVVTPISCNGENNGAIDLNLTGGIAPISVTWSDDASAGVQRNNLAAGTYTVIVLDSDTYQCPIEQTFVLTNPPAIAVSSTVTDAIDCSIVNSGNIDLVVLGGTAPYSYSWSNGEVTQDLINISAGEYSVEIKDANNCMVTKQFNIFRQKPIQIDFKETIITDCDLKIVNRKTEAKVTGGFLPYTYSWSAGTVSVLDSSIMTTSQNGSYTLTITDAKGCTKSNSFLIDVPKIGDTDFRYNAFAIEKYDLLSIKDPIQFTNLSTGNYSNVTWNFGDGSPIISEENPIHIYDTTGTFKIILTVEYDAGCIYKFERTVNITLGYSLVNPTAFTPNGDGYNETIRPSHRGFIELEMTIYNTWGTAIYSEKNTNLNGWNGTIKGQPAESGNYVMVVRGITFYKKEIRTSTPLTLLK
ncbi:hypothetical protein CW731_08415 [Polaribacter sp. ALD11]|uniref:PKD domain-containing protein n=1 Tax=Polaribacter sp. ALD11 TaxID=2058137 RepID=UPI000C30A77F|nr:PKD domain-containing protein [Polaribacter sp. ALD11]AUC85312.1 hypothetical protein CW731_08415 [Polaribacter sp. ALD11]